VIKHPDAGLLRKFRPAERSSCTGAFS
jgi:hypothetical protein